MSITLIPLSTVNALRRSAWLILLGGLLAILQAPASAADTPANQIAAWAASARATDASFSPSAERGKRFFLAQSAHNADMPGCATCHSSNPTGMGKHAVTGKPIQPLSPLANAERFADAARTEKWFKRNCNDVLGRVCSPAEKADLVSYLLALK